jgi:alkylation response protein AidB-like acyl-CoA dehydrogenase
LNTGPNDSCGVRWFVETAARSLAQWASERVQWGVPIGQHYAIAGKIARWRAILCHGSDDLPDLALVDKKEQAISDRNRDVQMWSTEMTLEDRGRRHEVRGGRGLKPSNRCASAAMNPPRSSDSCVIAAFNLIFEGSSEIMRLLLRAKRSIRISRSAARF